MQIEHWHEKWGELNEANLRRRLEDEGYSVARYVYSPGTTFPEHTHPHEKKDAVIKGQFKISMAGRDFVLGPGDILHVPAGAAHSAQVIGDEAVVSLDATRQGTVSARAK